MEFLKELFGENALTYEELAEALKSNKEIKLANLATGAYVGKEKFDALEVDRNGLKKQLDEANQQIESFKELDIDGIKAAADEWKEKFEKSEKDRETELSTLKFDHAIDAALSGTKAKDANILKSLLNKDELKLTEDGKVLGLDEQLSKIKEEKGFLFEPDEKEPVVIVGGGTGGTGGGNAKDAAIRNALGLKTIKGE